MPVICPVTLKFGNVQIASVRFLLDLKMITMDTSVCIARQKYIQSYYSHQFFFNSRAFPVE